MKRLFPWIAVLLFFLGAALLVAHFGAGGLWIVVIAASIALVAILGQIKSSAGRDAGDAHGRAAHEVGRRKVPRSPRRRAVAPSGKLGHSSVR